MAKLKFKPGVFMSGFFMFFFPLLIFLGIWQINRGIEKQEVWDKYLFNKSQPPLVEIEALNQEEEKIYYRSIILKGNYTSKSFFLDNRSYRKKTGFEVFTLFETSNKRNYLINRGWIARDMINSMSVPEGEQQIEGLFTPFVRFGLDLSETKSENKFPVIVQELDYELARSFLSQDMKLENNIIQLSPNSSGALETLFKPSIFKAERHWGYAVQWLGLAFVLFFLFIYFGLKQGKKEK